MLSHDLNKHVFNVHIIKRLRCVIQVFNTCRKSPQCTKNTCYTMHSMQSQTWPVKLVIYEKKLCYTALQSSVFL